MKGLWYWIVHEYAEDRKHVSENVLAWQQVQMDNGTTEWTGEGWKLEVKVLKHEGNGKFLYEASLSRDLNSDTACCYVLELRFKAEAKADEVYSLFPGAVYAHNRSDKSLPLSYAPRLNGFQDSHPDGPIYIGDIPRFSEDTDYHLIQQTYELTSPACGLYSDKEQSGIWISAAIGTLAHPNGFQLRSSGAHEPIELSVLYPAIRNRRYRQTARWETSPDEPKRLSHGEKLRATGTLHQLSAANRNQWIGKVARVMGDQARLQPDPQPMLPYSHAVKLIEQKTNDCHWRESLSYYSDGPKDKLQVGWVSGTSLVYCLLITGDATSRERALRELDFILQHGITPAGLHYGIYDDGEWKGKPPFTGLDFAGAHIRRVADMYYYMLKMLDKDLLAGSIRSKCEGILLKGIEQFQNIGRTYGHFGHSVDLATGKVLWGGSAAGVTCLTLLAKASVRYDRKDWLETAIVVEQYYRKLLQNGQVTGGPGDILMAPDSESIYAMLEAYWALYQATGNATYLLHAREAADLFSTWVYTHHYELPAGSNHGRIGIRSKGLVMANAQNKHGAPGICTASGDVLISLYEATGDRFYIQLLSAIKRAVPQTLNREPGYIEGAQLGEIAENVNVADAMRDRGQAYFGSVWAELAMWLGYIETPSVYMSANDEVFILDDCYAEMINEKLQITNPTQYAGKYEIVHGANRWKITVPAMGTVAVSLA